MLERFHSLANPKLWICWHSTQVLAYVVNCVTNCYKGMGNHPHILYNKSMNKNIFITNEAARKDPVVIAAMKSILKQMSDEHDRQVAGIAPDTVEVSPVNFLQDVLDDLGDPQLRDREREEYFRNGWGDSRNGCYY